MHAHWRGRRRRETQVIQVGGGGLRELAEERVQVLLGSRIRLALGMRETRGAPRVVPDVVGGGVHQVRTGLGQQLDDLRRDLGLALDSGLFGVRAIAGIVAVYHQDGADDQVFVREEPGRSLYPLDDQREGRSARAGESGTLQLHPVLADVRCVDPEQPLSVRGRSCLGSDLPPLADADAVKRLGQARLGKIEGSQVLDFLVLAPRDCRSEQEVAGRQRRDHGDDDQGQDQGSTLGPSAVRARSPCETPGAARASISVELESDPHRQWRVEPSSWGAAPRLIGPGKSVVRESEKERR